MNEILDGPTPGSLDEQIEMAQRQAEADVPGAQVDLGLLEDLRDGKLTVEEVAARRPELLAAAKRPTVQASAPRSYPDTITDPIDPPTVGGTDVTLTT